MDRRFFNSEEQVYQGHLQHDLDPIQTAFLAMPYQHHNLSGSQLSLSPHEHEQTNTPHTTRGHDSMYSQLPQHTQQSSLQYLQQPQHNSYIDPGPLDAQHHTQNMYTQQQPLLAMHSTGQVIRHSHQHPMRQSSMVSRASQGEQPSHNHNHALKQDLERLNHLQVSSEQPLHQQDHQGGQLVNSASDERNPMQRMERLGRLGSHGGLGRIGVLPSSVSATEGNISDGVGEHTITRQGNGGGGATLPASRSIGSSSNAVTSSTAAGQQNQATKDAHGKFPCGSCHKTYLHLKHLKRHLLRHSGDRPYQCVLCKDTFSRSDILKRHFQKCSLRRGNPAGFTHLAHAHDHQKKKPKGNNRDQGAGQSTRPRNNDTYSSNISVMGLNTFNQSLFPDDSAGNTPTDSCDDCLRLNLQCNGDTPCLNCRNTARNCKYSTEFEPEEVASKGDNSTEDINFSHSTHPRGYLSENSNHIQTYQHQQASQSTDNLTLRSSASFHTFGESPYGAHGEFNNISSTSLGEYSLQPQQSHFQQQQMTPSREDLRACKVESETASLNNVPPQNNPLTYYDHTQPNTTAPEIWDFPADNTTFYNPDSSKFALQSHSSDSSLFTFNNTPITENNLPILEGLVDWNIPVPAADPFQLKCDHIREILFSDFNSPQSPEYVCTPPSDDGTVPPADDSDLKEWVTAHHIKHFWELYVEHFQAHFPALHIPTFDLNTAYDGIVMGVMCYGAVYSDRGITVNQVRRLMERCMSLIERSDPRPPNQTQNPRILSVDELQTRLMFASLCNWHGSDGQRERNRKKFGKLVTFARNSYFFRPLTIRDNPVKGWSYYHQTDRTLKLRQEWNWKAWVEQEERNRVMFGIYLLDAALVLYWNEKPRIGIYELRLTLPADDAAWDAPTSEQCANLLGINGPEASARNISGTRQAKQPELSVQVEELLTIGKGFAAGKTNAYGKFILIHALHVYISVKQKEFGLGQWGYQLAQNPSNDPSHSSSTQQKNLEILHFHQTIAQALEKWKKCWDVDLASQYPNTRRTGFCRDGVAFYWLAVLFTHQKKRDLVLRDVRDRQVITQIQQMLEMVNRRPVSELPKPQQGATSNIDKSYGVDELAFDLRLLLAPVKKSPEMKPEDEKSTDQQVGQQPQHQQLQSSRQNQQATDYQQSHRQQQQGQRRS